MAALIMVKGRHRGRPLQNMKFKKITIIGVGLIGGSIGLAIKKRRLAKEVIGVFRRDSTLKRALRRKAIDTGTLSVEEGVKGAGLIILAAPVSLIPVISREVIKHAEKGAVITDVGSTKKWIVDKVERLPRKSSGVFFVGSHPMAGSEHAGVEFAREDLLENSPCIVTKTPKTNRTALEKVVNFWKALGARVEIMSPAAHDRSVSLISHLPHIVAFSLAGAVPVRELARAAEGFKDTTRVASSDPSLWTDIFLSNKKEILRSRRVFEKYYKKIMKAITDGNRRETVRLLKKAKAVREAV